MRTLLLLFIFLKGSFLGFSQDIIRPNQTTEIIFDYKTGKVSGILPFDKQLAFIIKNHEENAIRSAQVYEVTYKKNKRQIRFTEKLNDCDITPVVEQTLKFKPYQESKTSSVAYIHPLKPERLYEILVVKDNSAKNLSVLFEYFDLFRQNTNEKKLKEYYIQKVLPLEDQNAYREIGVGVFPPIHEDFEEIINKRTFNFLTSKDSIPKLKESFTDVIPSDTIIKHIGKQIKINKLNISAYSRFINKFLRNQTVAINEYITGKELQDLSRLNAELVEAKIKNDKKRIDIIKKNINKEVLKFNALKIEAQLKKNKNLLEIVKKDMGNLRAVVLDSIVDDFEENFIDPLHQTIKSNYKIVGTYLKESEKILNNKLTQIYLISAETHIGDLKTSNAKSLIPDFGIVNAFGHNSDGDFKYIARPYVGLNWHIGGINREQQLKEITDKSFRHRFSISLGVTIGEIDTEDYEDLYNSISPTLGINYRVTRQIRFGVGALFVREKDPNPILDSNKVVLAPYASLSFDFDIIGRASKLFNTLGF